MGRVRRLAATVASATVLAGCALVTGVGDLRVDPLAGGGGVDPSTIDGDASSASDVTMVALDGAVPSDDAAIDGATTDGGEAGAGRLRDVTFENGTLIGIHGGDSVFGNPFPATGVAGGALAGNVSMRVDKGISGIEVAFVAVNELYASFLMRVQNTSSTASPLLTFLPAATGGVLAELYGLGAQGALSIVVGGNPVASGGSIGDGTIARIGVHLRQDASSSFVEVFLATGAAAFGMHVISATLPSLGGTVGARMGILANNGGLAKATFDNLLLDTRSMPGP
jgi:hypothetical protein